MFIPKPQQDALVSYVTGICRANSNRDESRYPMEQVDREYSRTNNEQDPEKQAAKLTNKRGGKKILEDVTVPVLFPQVESALSYLAGVFLTGYPLFGTVTSPENAAAGDMMDAVNAAHQIKGRWAPNLAKCFRDGLKYNKMGAEVVWETRKGLGLQRDSSGIAAKPIIWEGNAIRRIDMYNAIYDCRVPLNEVHLRGEFGGYYEIMSKVAFKMFLDNLNPEHRIKNTREALECAVGPTYFYMPEITDKLGYDPKDQAFLPSTWIGAQSSPDRIKYQGIYEITVLYCRLIPEEFDLRVPASGTPQIWKLIVVNSSVLIYAEKLVNAHGYLPTVFGEVYDDGLGNQTLSFGEQLLETQNMASALWNIRIASARRNVSDRGIYNPEFIEESAINSSNPSAKIPMRRGKFLDDIRKAYYPIPYDPSAAQAVIADAGAILDFGRSVSGISKPFEGSFMKGNRTLGEYQDIRGNGDARLQTVALFVQAQFLDPIKEIIKYNVLQFAKPDSVYFSVKKKRIAINPQVLQDAALDFKSSDGLLPSSKLADSDFLLQFMQIIAQNPEVQQQFDIVALISYLASLRNVPDIEAFRRQAPPPNAQPPSANPNGAPAPAQPGQP